MLRSGLSRIEVAKAREKYGANLIPSEEKRNLFKQFLTIASEPMLILLIAAGVINFFLAETIDAMMLMVTVLIVLGISIVQSRRTENALFALKSLSAPYARVIREGSEVKIPSTEIVVGDILKLHEGDRVSADAILLTSFGIHVDESLLTGESISVTKNTGDTVYSGTLITRGHGQGEVSAVGASSTLGKIGKSIQDIPFEKSQLQKDVDQLVRVIGILGIVTVLAVVTIYGSTRHNWLEGALAGIAAAMALIPEEFPVIMTLFLAIGAWRMSQVRVIARKPAAIEALGSITTLCVDKTGTLTLNKMAISQIQLDGHSFKVESTNPSEEVLETIKIGALACPNAMFDPMDLAFKELADKFSVELLHDSIKEFPVHSQQLAFIHAWRDEASFIIAAKGAPETIARLCRFSESELADITTRVHKAADMGFRILAIASARLPNNQEIPADIHDLHFEYHGLALIHDPIREGVVESIKDCAQAGIRTIMITGDHPSTAKAIARQIGLENPEKAITGSTLHEMKDDELQHHISDISVFARVTPEHKLRIIRALQQNDEIVAMTGDGVNDAPALRAADIGIAMGGRGTDVAREAASLVITDDNYTSIAQGIARGRTTFANLQKAMSYVIAIHIPIFGLALLPIFATSWPLILLPGLVAFHEVIIDPACSIVFEEEGPDPDTMNKRPRTVGSKVFTRNEVLLSVTQGFVIFICLAAIFLYSLNIGRSDDETRSLIFGTLMLCNIGLILTNRSRSLTVLETFRRRKNRTVKWVILGAISIIVVLINSSALRPIFNLGEVTLRDWLLMIFVAFISIAWHDVFKIVKRKSRLVIN